MKKILLTVLITLLCLVGFAKTTTINFDAMRMSEDNGASWSDRMPIKGRFVIVWEDEKKVSLFLGDDKQDYQIVSSDEKDGETTVQCKGTDNEKINLIFSPKNKEIIFATKDGMSNFRITKIENQ